MGEERLGWTFAARRLSRESAGEKRRIPRSGMMKTGQWMTILTLLGLIGVTAGCDTGTEPAGSGSFDADAALEDYQAVEALLASEAMLGFKAMAQGVTFQSLGDGAVFAAGVASNLSSMETPAGAGAFGTRLAYLGGNLWTPPARNPVISALHRGTTFVYDPALGRYVPDPELDGAPATGVRFILYERGEDGKPDVGAELGYVDLIDEGDESEEQIALLLRVVADGTTVLEYRTTVGVLATGGQITIAGYLQGIQDRLDFEIQVAGASDGQGATVDISFEMGIATRDFLITGTVHGAEGSTGSQGEVSLTVRHGKDSFSVTAVGSDQAIEGEFRLNGKLFATVEGDPASPTVTGAKGSELTLAEQLVLREILDSVEDVFDFFEDLLDPVDELVIIAVIL
jgi:hypothetical protein